jgi:uncharacterized protein YcbK (DUF882 family)
MHAVPDNEWVWKKLRHFKKDENWGDHTKMDPFFLMELDLFRGALGQRLVVTSGTQGVHSEKSWHYRGCAADVIPLGMEEIPAVDLLLLALRYGFTGVGLYPHWRYDRSRHTGLHLERAPGGPKRSMWLGVNVDGKQIYLPLTMGNLK